MFFIAGLLLVTTTAPECVLEFGPRALTCAFGIYGTSPDPPAFAPLVAGGAALVRDAAQKGAKATTGCTPFAAADYDGLVAVVDRGGCAFGRKAKHAQAGGFAALVIVDTAGAKAGGASLPPPLLPPALGPEAAGVTIPVLMLRRADGEQLRADAAAAAAGGAAGAAVAAAAAKPAAAPPPNPPMPPLPPSPAAAAAATPGAQEEDESACFARCEAGGVAKSAPAASHAAAAATAAAAAAEGCVSRFGTQPPLLRACSAAQTIAQSVACDLACMGATAAALLDAGGDTGVSAARNTACARYGGEGEPKRAACDWGFQAGVAQHAAEVRVAEGRVAEERAAVAKAAGTAAARAAAAAALAAGPTPVAAGAAAPALQLRVKRAGADELQPAKRESSKAAGQGKEGEQQQQQQQQQSQSQQSQQSQQQPPPPPQRRLSRREQQWRTTVDADGAFGAALSAGAGLARLARAGPAPVPAAAAAAQRQQQHSLRALPPSQVLLDATADRRGGLGGRLLSLWAGLAVARAHGAAAVRSYWPLGDTPARSWAAEMALNLNFEASGSAAAAGNVTLVGPTATKARQDAEEQAAAAAAAAAAELASAAGLVLDLSALAGEGAAPTPRALARGLAEAGLLLPPVGEACAAPLSAVEDALLAAFRGAARSFRPRPLLRGVVEAALAEAAAVGGGAKAAPVVGVCPQLPRKRSGAAAVRGGGGGGWPARAVFIMK
jgi:hypothetical protein